MAEFIPAVTQVALLFQRLSRHADRPLSALADRLKAPPPCLQQNIFVCVAADGQAGAGDCGAPPLRLIADKHKLCGFDGCAV